ncbi:hypothetical protein [Paludibaculum fermentans]|uniref:hypothetical protein n=1 Tax=Paludibaculum fermentans TaxID=1473598 RepID=UPI003EBDC074
MRIILHLLRKDIRQWWYEITVTLLVLFTAAFTAAAPVTTSTILVVSLLTSYLSPVLIMLLVGRVMQAELWPSPLEDWRTRPISRTHMLGAKALFLALFLVLPSWLGYLIVFRASGYSSSVWLQESPALLFGMTTLILLPSSAVMATTTNLGKAILTAVGLYLGVSVISVGLSGYARWTAPPQWRLTVLYSVLVALVALAGLYYQIICSRTLLARVALVLGWSAVAILSSPRLFLDNTPLRDWLNPMPVALQGMTLKVSRPADGTPAAPAGTGAGDVVLRFLAELEGMPDGMVVEPNVANGSLCASDGSRYRLNLLPWRASAETRRVYDLSLPRRQYEELRAQPVELELQVWAFVYSNPKLHTATIQNSRLKLPDLFECALMPLQGPRLTAVPQVECTTMALNLRSLEADLPSEKGVSQFPVTAYGTDGLELFRGVGGQALRREISSGGLMLRWKEGQQVQVRHYQSVYQWHKTVRLSGIHLDDYRQTE